VTTAAIALCICFLPVEAAEFRASYPNGLEAVLVPEVGRPAVGIMALVGAGLRCEDAGNNGVTHFLEHLLFNGTEALTQEELYEEIDLLGGYCNAASREECTLYLLILPPENLSRGLWLLGQMLYHSLLIPEKVEKERGIILSEIRQDRASEAQRARDVVRSVLYGGTQYSMPILGTEQGIQSLQRDEIVSYYRRFYVPNNTTLLVMGALNIEDCLAAIDSTFARELPGTVPPCESVTPPLRPGKITRTTRLEKARTYVVADTPSPGQPGYEAHELLVEILRLRSGEGNWTEADLQWHVFGDRGRLILGAVADDNAAPEELGGGLTSLLGGLRSVPPTAEEITAARSRLVSEELFLREKFHHYVIMKANELWAAGPEFVVEHHQDLAEVSNEALAEAALTLGDESSFTEILCLPPAPDTAAVAARTLDTLLAGMRTIIRHQPDAPVFALHVLFRDRSLMEPPGRTGIAELLHRVAASGPDGMDVAREWASLGARVTFYDNPYFSHDDIYVSPRYSYVRFQCPTGSWREGVRMLSRCLTEPPMGGETLEKARSDVLRALAYRRGDARYLARRRFAELLLKDHPAGADVLGTYESVSGVTSEDVRGFWESYVHAENAIVTVVGSVPCGQVLTELGDFLPRIGTTQQRVWPALGSTDGGSSSTDTLGSGRAYVVWGYLLGEIPARDRAPLRLVVSSLSNLLAQRVREDRGLAYGVGASLRWVGDEAWMQVEVGTRSEVAEEVMAVIKTTVEEQRGRAFSEQEVAREAQRRRGRVHLRSLSRVGEAYYLGLEKLLGHHPLEGEESVGTQDMVRVAKLYLRTEPAVMAIVR
jgi:predicted Zn-dependent peptidase